MRTIASRGRAAGGRCGFTCTSSSGAFSCTSCPRASTASAIKACSPAQFGRAISAAFANRSPRPRPHLSARVPSRTARPNIFVSASMPLLWRPNDHRRNLRRRTPLPIATAEPDQDRHLMIIAALSASQPVSLRLPPPAAAGSRCSHDVASARRIAATKRALSSPATRTTVLDRAGIRNPAPIATLPVGRQAFDSRARA